MKKTAIIVCAALLWAVSMTACSHNAPQNVLSDSTQVLTEVKTTQFFTEDKVPEADMKLILSAGVNAPSAMNTQPWHFTAITDEATTQKLADAMSSMKPSAMNGKPFSPDMAPGDKPKQPPTDHDGDAPTPPADYDGDAPVPPMDREEGAPTPPADREGDVPMPPEGKGDFSKMPNKAGIGDAPLTIVISCEEGAELSAGLAVQNMSAEAQLLGYGTKILTSPTMALNGENQEEYKALLNIPDNQKVAAVLLVGKAVSEQDNPDVVSNATQRNSFDEVVTVIGQ